MLELSYLLGWLAAALLLLAVTLSFRPGRGRLLQRPNGLIATANDDMENVSRLLVGAVVLSAMAAVLAIARWMFA
jgi:hypothetical protein